MSDLIDRQAVIDAVNNAFDRETLLTGFVRSIAVRAIRDMPSAQSDIIRCNACKHWTQTIGNMPGFGLGDCNYLNAKLVSCNGYCYWAERREG